MFKYTQALLLLALLVAHGTNPCSADFDDSQPDLKSDVEELAHLVENLGTETVEQLERSLPCDNGYPGTACQKKVAFYVGLNKNFGPVSRVTDIAFDNIVTNIGSGYSASGRFKAPVTGTYQFSVNIAAQHTKAAAVTMLKNGHRVMTVWSDARPNWTPSSNVAILSLNVNDQVWLQVGIYNWPSSLFGNMCSSFSGFLIFEN